jgi:hypothetical protein
VDCRGGDIRRLICALLLGAMGAAAVFAAPAQLFQSLRWTAPGQEITTLSKQPSACLVIDAASQAEVRAGLALFNAPALLGGQAAKAGLSCASCHVNGRSNPHFLLPSLSGNAGTADVTNSFFGPARGNGISDPVPIPDLAIPGKVSRAPADPALILFTQRLIVDEFSGKQPSTAMLRALAAYMRAIQSCAGDKAADQHRRLDDQLVVIYAALDGANMMHQIGDHAAANVLLSGARHQLGLIDERYAAVRFKQERRLLLNASKQLQTIANVPEQRNLPKLLQNWRQDFGRNVTPRLKAGEIRSLYDEIQIKAAFGQ